MLRNSHAWYDITSRICRHWHSYSYQNFAGGAQADESQIWNFYSTAIKWMDQQNYIGSYFAFGEHRE